MQIAYLRYISYVCTCRHLHVVVSFPDRFGTRWLQVSWYKYSLVPRPSREWSRNETACTCTWSRPQTSATRLTCKRLALLLAAKHDKPYSNTVHWLRCRLSFSLLRSAIMCMQGSRSTIYHPAGPSISGDHINLACSEGRVPTLD